MLRRRKKIQYLSIILSLQLLLYSGFESSGIPLAFADGLTTTDQTNLSLSKSVKLDSLGPNSIELLADMINPTIDLSSLFISRTSAIPGDTVSIKVKAADDPSPIKWTQFSHTCIVSRRNATKVISYLMIISLGFGLSQVTSPVLRSSRQPLRGASQPRRLWPG